MRTLLLTLHLVGVAAWLGANLVQLSLGRFYAAQGVEARLAWLRATTLLAQRYYNAAGTLIGVSGVLLVLDGGWSWGSGFVWIGIAVLVIGGVLGAVEFVPTGRHLAEALRAGAAERIRALDRRAVGFAVLDTSLVVLAVVAMVHKWGA
ncbi:MAG: hypothetical protein KDB40_12515 [Acidimicrobiales bacterium]|nr:hypothetical protein [Acidimicrobiales bacterium]MCB9394334.1 hypothetical protein [Acidimicrobiaceae bacterium]